MNNSKTKGTAVITGASTGIGAIYADRLAKRGYDPKMGARPMARVIQEFIKRPLAEELLFGKLVNGGHVEVTLSEDGEKLKLDSRAVDQPALLSHES